MKKPAAKVPARVFSKPKPAVKAGSASLKVKQASVSVPPKASTRAAKPAAARPASVAPPAAPPIPTPVAASAVPGEAFARTAMPPAGPAVQAPAAVAPQARPEAAPVAAGLALVRRPDELGRVPAAPAPRGFPATVARPAPARPIAPGRPAISLPPRAPAPAEIFVEGDHVVYPTHGVGKIERIVTESIAGYRLELIHITFEENRMTLRVPVEKARSAGLRKLASRQLFEAALTTLKGRARIKRTMWSRRAQEYEAKINSGDPLAIAEVVRDLHRNAGQPDQSFSERQIYEAAMDRLAAELAALDNTDKATAAEKLTTFLKTP
ncbi:MAG: CarD family transcriptional regulator [Rhodospirillales bacterium]|nr:CarD family transcriptional regulator [Rhodospirillales bacterium]